VCDVISKCWLTKLLLLLSAAASAATISLVAFSCKLTLTVNTITSQVRQRVLRHVIPPSSVIGCNIFASCIFPNTFESLQLLHAGIAALCMQ